MELPVGIALVGCGTVGSAVAQMLLDPAPPHPVLERLELRSVTVRDPSKIRHPSLAANLLRRDWSTAVTDPQTQIIVELIGGIDEAHRLILAALAAGKNVVTANKALLAAHGPELFATARAANRCIAFEASVCAGIPLIESIRRGLAANRINAVMGIMNGTCNFILTRMCENNSSYAHALSEAQRLGYAEADPALDVSGNDAAQKLEILAGLALRQRCRISPDNIRGIANIQLMDLRAGEELGYACKLLAIAQQRPDGVHLTVQPTFVPSDHPLANVHGPFNAVSVYGHPIGHVFLYGPGAGGPATASAVVSDIIDVAIGNAQRSFDTWMGSDNDQKTGPTTPSAVAQIDFDHCPHYIRLALLDQPGGIGQVATLLAQSGISIATIVQRQIPAADPNRSVPVIITTHPAAQLTVRTALAKATTLKCVTAEPICIPVLVSPQP